MSYVMSDEIKGRIQRIPNFKTDIYKIKSISTVKSNYGIDSDEIIISYRVVPQLFAKLEKGGAVFTDKGVYKRLPSGYLSSDFVTYGIKYEDMVEYIPFLGYSMDQQPQLVGEYTEKKNLSFWMTPVAGTESNDEIVSIFCAIIREVSLQDKTLGKIYDKTKTKCLNLLENIFDSDGNVSSKDEAVLKMLVESKQFSGKQMEDAIFFLFRIRFANRDYSTAYNLVEENSDYLLDASFIERIDPIIRNKIETIGVPETYGGVEALKLYCKKNNTYIESAFPNIVSYYFREGEYDSVDEFMVMFENESFYENMTAVLKTKIEETLPRKVEDWTKDKYSYSDERFVIYAMNKPSFYRTAAQELVKHYCVLGQFDAALESLEKVRAAEDNAAFLEELKEFIKGYTVIYADEQFKKAQEYIEGDDKRAAISCLQEAVKYDSEKQEYALCLIQTELDLADYSLAKQDIGIVLERKVKFNSEGNQKLHELEVECAEGLNQEMCAFYDLLVNNNDESLVKDSSSLSKVDQLGLSFYHYAILLKKEDVVARIDVSATSAQAEVCNYELGTFGAGAEEVDQTFIQLLKLYDDDAKKLYKDYKRKKAGNTVKEIGAGILGAIIDSAISSASNADSKLRQMERDSSYSSHRDEITDRRYEIQGKRDQMKDMRSQLRDYSDGNIQSGDELYDEYIDKLVELAFEKIVMYANKLDESVSNDSFKSKLIYMIIKNPKLLDEIFHGDREHFALHEIQGDFWYLPESLIIDANNLTIQYIPRKISVFETNDDSYADYDGNEDDDEN